MVHYIGKENQNNLGWKKYLLIGGVSLAALAGAVKGIFSCVKASPVSEENVESVLNDLEKNPESLKQSYDQLVSVVEKGLEENPKYANRLVQSGLEALQKSNEDIEQATYMAMFQRIRDKAEQRPELMDHFGEKARGYLEKKFVEDYSAIIERSFKESANTLSEKSKPVIDALGMAKDYVLKKFQEE